jgi:hypothetical protein
MVTKGKRETAYESDDLESLIYEVAEIRSGIIEAEAEMSDRKVSL